MYTLRSLHQLPHEVILRILIHLSPKYLQQMMRADKFWHDLVDDTFCVLYIQHHCVGSQPFTKLRLRLSREELLKEVRQALQTLFNGFCFECSKRTNMRFHFFQRTVCANCQTLPEYRLITASAAKRVYRLSDRDLKALTCHEIRPRVRSRDRIVHINDLRKLFEANAVRKLYSLPQVKALANAKKDQKRIMRDMREQTYQKARTSFTSEFEECKVYLRPEDQLVVATASLAWLKEVR